MLGLAELAVDELLLFLAVVAVELRVLLSQGLQLRVLAVGKRGEQFGKSRVEKLSGLFESGGHFWGAEDDADEGLVFEVVGCG